MKTATLDHKETRRNNWVKKHMDKAQRPKTHKPSKGKGHYDRKDRQWTKEVHQCRT